MSSYILTGLLVTCGIVTGIQTEIYSKINSHCARTSCLKLYQTKTRLGVTWKESKQYCADNGMTLAGIPTPSTQARVENLLKQDIYKRDTWLSGKRDYNDIQWSSLDGTPVNTLVVKLVDAGDCAILVSGINVPSKFQTTRCDDVTTGHTSVCQYRPNETGSCMYCASCEEAFDYEGACYINVTESRGNWFDAQNLCREKYGGHLAYARYTIQILLQLSTETPTGKWTGIHRRPWQWTSGTMMENEPIRMQYFNWVRNFTDDGFTKNCVKLSEDGTWWNVEDCSARLNQFICIQEILTDTTQLPMITTSEENTTLIAPPPPVALNVIAIAVPVAAVCVLGLLVLGVVIYFQKKRRNQKGKITQNTDPAPNNANINPVPTKQRSFYMVQLGSSTPPQVRNDTFTASADTEAPPSPSYDSTSQEPRFLSSQTSAGYEDVSDMQTDERWTEQPQDMYLTLMEEQSAASEPNGITSENETPQSPNEYEDISNMTEEIRPRISLGEYLTPITTNVNTGQYELPTTYVNNTSVHPSVYERLEN